MNWLIGELENDSTTLVIPSEVEGRQRKMAEEKITHNPECSSESHSKHLCYIVSQGFHLSDAETYKELVKDAEFKCQHCGRLAKSADNLCVPVEL